MDGPLVGATPLAQLDPVVQLAVVLFPFVHVMVAAEAASGCDAATARARARSLCTILLIFPSHKTACLHWRRDRRPSPSDAFMAKSAAEENWPGGQARGDAARNAMFQPIFGVLR